MSIGDYLGNFHMGGLWDVCWMLNQSMLEHGPHGKMEPTTRSSGRLPPWKPSSQVPFGKKKLNLDVQTTWPIRKVDASLGLSIPRMNIMNPLGTRPDSFGTKPAAGGRPNQARTRRKSSCAGRKGGWTRPIRYNDLSITIPQIGRILSVDPRRGTRFGLWGRGERGWVKRRKQWLLNVEVRGIGRVYYKASCCALLGQARPGWLQLWKRKGNRS